MLKASVYRLYRLGAEYSELAQEVRESTTKQFGTLRAAQLNLMGGIGTAMLCSAESYDLCQGLGQTRVLLSLLHTFSVAPLITGASGAGGAAAAGGVCHGRSGKGQ